MVRDFTFRQRDLLTVILLITAWLLGNLWTFQWWIESWQSISILNIAVLAIAAIALFLFLFRKNSSWLKLSSPKLSLYPILLILTGEIGAIILKWSLNIPQLILLFFILGSYGLLGLFNG